MADLGLEDLIPFFDENLGIFWDIAEACFFRAQHYVLIVLSHVTVIQIAYTILIIAAIAISYTISHKKVAELRFQYTLLFCWRELLATMERSHCQPLLLRLAFADAVSYDYKIADWPRCGGVNGSIRFEALLSEPFHAGLNKAILILTPLKKKYSIISWADLIQMAGAAAVYSTGGPLICLVYGRVDLSDQHADTVYNETSEYTNLPQVFPPYPSCEPTVTAHLRLVFNRLGLTCRDTVALMGAHTIGRAFQERSGVCPYFSGEQGATAYTKLTSLAYGTFKRKNNKKEMQIGMAGGCSWTINWLQFDNSYFRRPQDDPHNKELLWLPTDEALSQHPLYSTYFSLYARDQQAFFDDFSIAYKKMSELGAKFERYVMIPFK